MLKALIKRYLELRGLSMREASRRAGAGPTWLKNFLASKKKATIGFTLLLNIGEVLEIPLNELVAADRADVRGTKRDRASREAAIEEISRMSAEEISAFLASRHRNS